MQDILQIGFQNYVISCEIIGILDIKLPSVKRLIRSAKEEKPRSVIDVSRGRKSQSVILLKGDRYVISAISRIQLMNRLLEEEDDAEEEVKTVSPPKNLRGKRKSISDEIQNS